MPLTVRPTLYAIGDARDGWPPAVGADQPLAAYAEHWRVAGPGWLHSRTNPNTVATARDDLAVVGGYMERLPLACVKAGIVDYAEMWHFTREPGVRAAQFAQPFFGSRQFHMHTEAAPFHANDMLAFLETYGAPDVLCVWGLGVSEAILEACNESFIIYYSLDAPPLRVPPECSRHFDLIMVGAEWQRDEVHARHPDVACELLTIGPEFADSTTFRPLELSKEYDLIYVAAAQPYKRHDILFNGLARCSQPVRCLCVCGYGELGEELRQSAHALGIDVDFIGPPGVSYAEVNTYMNRAKIGVVAGIDDGCPAILTEYMLAGLPVLANNQLCCGLRFITPETGIAAAPDTFHTGIETLLDQWATYHPREYAIKRWGWQASVQRLHGILASNGFRKPSRTKDQEPPYQNETRFFPLV